MMRPWIWVVVGTLIGAGVGIAVRNVAIGAGIGVALGAALAGSQSRR